MPNKEKKYIHPKFAQIDRAHGLPKTPKKYEVLPPFWPLVDITNIPYYGITKFLANLLKIEEIPKELFDSGISLLVWT